MAWDKSQVRDFVKRAKVSNNSAWTNPMFTDAFREALLAREFTRVVTGQAMETLKTESVDQLWQDMIKEAGLGQ